MDCPVFPIDLEFAAACLPRRRPDGHKGTFGKVLIVGGSVGYTGAPYLAASAAVRSGCGLVYLGVPEGIWAVEAAKCASAMPFPLPAGERLGPDALAPVMEKLEQCDVLAVGPGLGRAPDTAALVREVLRRTEKPVVVDADGINALEGHIDILEARRGRATILTPHDGEFARLTGLPLEEIARGDRPALARAFAMDHGCFLVLKGHPTHIAAPQGTVLVNGTGGSGLARGGSGDVLTGLIASLLAQGTPPAWAAGCGVWLHGRAGDLAEAALTPYAMTPEDVVAWFPEAFREAMEAMEEK